MGRLCEARLITRGASLGRKEMRGNAAPYSTRQ